MPIPPVASRLGRLGLLAAALSGAAGAAHAQVPSPSPTIPNIAEDEKDFLGLTSLALGSGARAFGMATLWLAPPDAATQDAVNAVEPTYRPDLVVASVEEARDVLRAWLEGRAVLGR